MARLGRAEPGVSSQFAPRGRGCCCRRRRRRSGLGLPLGFREEMARLVGARCGGLRRDVRARSLCTCRLDSWVKLISLVDSGCIACCALGAVLCVLTPFSGALNPGLICRWWTSCVLVRAYW